MFTRIYSCIRSIISSFGLLDPEELASRLDLRVLKVLLNTARGMVLASSVLAINASLPLSQQRGVILHECGHRVLHTGESRFFLEQDTFYLPGRKELEANLFALFYLYEWDKGGFEECGGDLFRFADTYGVPRRAAEVMMSSARSNFGKRLCG